MTRRRSVVRHDRQAAGDEVGELVVGVEHGRGGRQVDTRQHDRDVDLAQVDPVEGGLGRDRLGQPPDVDDPHARLRACQRREHLVDANGDRGHVDQVGEHGKESAGEAHRDRTDDVDDDGDRVVL